jgi:hypothetical protein
MMRRRSLALVAVAIGAIGCSSGSSLHASFPSSTVTTSTSGVSTTSQPGSVPTTAISPSSKAPTSGPTTTAPSFLYVDFNSPPPGPLTVHVGDHLAVHGLPGSQQPPQSGDLTILGPGTWPPPPCPSPGCGAFTALKAGQTVLRQPRPCQGTKCTSVLAIIQVVVEPR